MEIRNRRGFLRLAAAGVTPVLTGCSAVDDALPEFLPEAADFEPDTRRPAHASLPATPDAFSLDVDRDVVPFLSPDVVGLRVSDRTAVASDGTVPTPPLPILNDLAADLDVDPRTVYADCATIVDADAHPVEEPHVHPGVVATDAKPDHWDVHTAAIGSLDPDHLCDVLVERHDFTHAGTYAGFTLLAAPSSSTELALSPHVFLRAASPIAASVDVYTGIADRLPDEYPAVARVLDHLRGGSYDAVTCTNAGDLPEFPYATAAVGLLPVEAGGVESDSVEPSDERRAVFVFSFDHAVSGEAVTALTRDAVDVENLVIGSRTVRFEATVPT